MKNIKFKITDLFYLGIVICAGVIVGDMIQMYLDWNHPSYHPKDSSRYISIFVFVILFLCAWIATPNLLLGKNITLKEAFLMLKKDAFTYVPFCFLYFYRFHLEINHALPFLTFFIFLLLKLVVFRQYIKLIVERIEFSFIFLTKIPEYIKKVYCYANEKNSIFLKKHDRIISRIYIAVKLLMIIYIVLIGLSRIHQMYSIPVSKPYFVGTWDEPFSINAGINILHTKGDQQFYNYGGTSAIPYAITFWAYSLKHDISPYYKFLGEKFYETNFPIYRNIYPTKPIYITKVIAYILFIIGCIVFISFFSWYLLPVPFLLFRMIDMSRDLSYYKMQLMGNTHITLLAGITTAIFFLTLLNTNDFKKYFRYLILCCIAASVTIAAKISTAYIVFLPLSLLIYMYRAFDVYVLAQKRLFLKCMAALILPYILINPGILLHTSSYISWLRHRASQATLPAFTWITDERRLNNLFRFLQDLYLIKYLPNLWLIFLSIISTILMVRINPLAFIGIAFFHLYSLQTIINITSDVPYSRLYLFLLLTHGIFILFPFIYFYKHIPKYIKVFIVIVGITFTIRQYSLTGINEGVGKLFSGTFINTWDKESRDDLIKYVKENDVDVFFFDYHHFSLPENIHDRLIPFVSVNDVPQSLSNKQRIGFIQYNISENSSGKQKKYYDVVSFLMKKYKISKILGPEKPSYASWGHSPISNPSIVLLEQRN